jgi:hypothetical protein
MSKLKTSIITFFAFVSLLSVQVVAQDYEDNEETSVDLSDSTNNRPKHHHRISLEFSFSSQKDETKSNAPQWYREYQEKLTSGQALGASWMVFWPSNLGYGFCLSKYWANASQENMAYIKTTYPYDTTIGMMEDKISTIFLGIAVGFRKELKKHKLEISGDARLGPFFYFDDYSFAGSTVELSSMLTVGYGGNLCIEYKVSDNFSFLGGLTGLIGSVKELTTKDGTPIDLPEPISLNRLDINLGIRIHFDVRVNDRRNQYIPPTIWMPPPVYRFN